MKTFELEMNSLKTTASDLQLEKSRCCFEKNTQQQYNYGDCLFSVCLLSVTSTDTDGRTLEIAKRKKTKTETPSQNYCYLLSVNHFFTLVYHEQFYSLRDFKRKIRNRRQFGSGIVVAGVVWSCSPFLEGPPV